MPLGRRWLAPRVLDSAAPVGGHCSEFANRERRLCLSRSPVSTEQCGQIRARVSAVVPPGPVTLGPGSLPIGLRQLAIIYDAGIGFAVCENNVTTNAKAEYAVWVVGYSGD